jgi:hypothetical protein
MSSGKPQTRGLAALLRIEKERRAREEAGADEPADAALEPGPRAVVPHAVSPEVWGVEGEAAPAANEETAYAAPDSPERAAEEVAEAAPTQQPAAAPAPASSPRRRVLIVARSA